jgi:CHASE3 domain sensor protein
MMRHWSLARKITVAFALGPIALIIVGVVTYLSTTRLLQT